MIPEQSAREYANDLAFRLVRERLAGIGDIEEQCRRCEARYLAAEKAVTVDYLDRPYRIDLASAVVSPVAEEDTISVQEQLLVLHYFTQAKGTHLSGKPITYKELADGINYFPVFSKRAIQPVVTFFGDEPEQLLEAAATMGGCRADYGDFSVTIPVFRRVPVTFVLWKGDAEFAPEGNLMFDSTVSDYLTNDDIHTCCEKIAWKLARLRKTGGGNPGRG